VSKISEEDSKKVQDLLEELYPDEEIEEISSQEPESIEDENVKIPSDIEGHPTHPECKKCESPKATAHFQEHTIENKKPEDLFVLEEKIYDPDEHESKPDKKYNPRTDQIKSRINQEVESSGVLQNVFKYIKLFYPQYDLPQQLEELYGSESSTTKEIKSIRERLLKTGIFRMDKKGKIVGIINKETPNKKLKCQDGGRLVGELTGAIYSALLLSKSKKKKEERRKAIQRNYETTINQIFFANIGKIKGIKGLELFTLKPMERLKALKENPKVPKHVEDTLRQLEKKHRKWLERSNLIDKRDKKDIQKEIGKQLYYIFSHNVPTMSSVSIDRSIYLIMKEFEPEFGKAVKPRTPDMRRRRAIEK